MRLVIDTNVLVSALLFRGGATLWLRHAWQSERVRPLVSRDTVGELLAVLTYPKFGLEAIEREDILAEYLPWCEVVAVPVPPPAVPTCRDPFDMAFLHLAAAAGADALVTGDRDLHALAPLLAFPVLTPSELGRRLQP
ncbi:putative toxin-antitoxin system toxin component, PIN family [Magnetospirillum sp. UT-4]|uniref:putative toxin-antitoxin system toxin component, PIN family n=1 Tax=Magnetospirillum sp. UT-4 TaxID=2681467 RepID=UPI001384476F|nr:putative toxin-antitoxin system toxin component, PIN family [Magnetospirillum sp. UT-4]CAA7624226.1 conserved hypothetical protein [Magnetospirillum sp. UT-4]